MKETAVNLLEHITHALGGDEEKARTGLSVLFMTIWLCLDRPTFQLIRQAFPEAEKWAKHGASGHSGRTAEVLTLVTPETMTSRLRSAGLHDDEIAKLGDAVGGVLARSVGEDVMKPLAARIPLLSTAVR